MSCKITIELDGQTEQALIPAIRQAARHYPALFAAEGTTPGEGLYVENATRLQQQVQQLMVQNRLLQAQLSSEQKALPSGTTLQALPQIEAAAAHSRPHSQQQPELPARYRTGRRSKHVYRLKQAAGMMASRSWRLLVWICVGKEWLLIFLLLSGALFGALALVPKIEQQLLLRSPEFMDSSGDGPGVVHPTEQTNRQTNRQPEVTPNEPHAPETTLPADPASKAGSHPPPPPAFQTNP